jgi:hypothetical protein
MPTPVNESRANANYLQTGQGAWPLPTNMNGVTTGYPVYELRYQVLKDYVAGLSTLMTTDKSNTLSMSHPFCSSRRANHGDALGNLPFAAQPAHAFCEYHLPANGCPFPNHLRVIYDTYRRLFFISPCHYDPWTDISNANRNPFYLITYPPSVEFGGKINF